MSTVYADLAKRLPSWLYKLGAQLYIDKAYPRHLFVETTASCNLSCSYCPREKTRQDMDYRLFREIVDEASRYGARSFSLHLFGEPLLYPHIFEACAYIKRRNKRHTVLLTTNGTKVNDCIDDLVSCGINQVLWTWRKEARFTGATLLKLKKWGKFRVRFIKEITPPEAYEEWKTWGNVEGRKLHNYGGEIDTGRWDGLQEKSYWKDYSNSQKTSIRYPCYHLWLAPAVAWNGNILLCCSDPHQKEVLGKFPEQSVAEVWKGSQLESIRKSHLEGRYEGICKDCDVWKSYPSLF